MNAIRKYGKDAFSHEELAQCTSLKDANITEEILIEQYDTRNPEKGFNLLPGGLHTPHPVKNPWVRPGFREKMQKIIGDPIYQAKIQAASKAALEKKPSFKADMSRISKEAWSTPEYREKVANRICSAETRAKIAAANIGKKHSPETKAKLSAIVIKRFQTAAK